MSKLQKELVDEYYLKIQGELDEESTDPESEVNVFIKSLQSNMLFINNLNEDAKNHLKELDEAQKKLNQTLVELNQTSIKERTSNKI